MRFDRAWAMAHNDDYIDHKPYEYEEHKINKMADGLKLQPVTMRGVIDDLKSLKAALDNVIATADYFFLDYGLDEIAYHWDMNDKRNQEQVANMRKVLDGIQCNMKLMYAHVLAGLGERLPE